MTAAVCDDEKILCEQIEQLIKKTAPDCRVLRFSSGEAFLRAKAPVNILFLDIRLGGMDGIETAKALRAQNSDMILIFLTGCKEYALEAFDVSAFHYLLKPVEEQKFQDIFTKALAEAGKKNHREDGRLLLKSRGRHISLSRNDILYVESQNRKVYVHTNRDVLEIRADLKDLEPELGPSFYRCHKGYLVHMGHIAEYEKDQILLTNGENVYLSRRKYQDFVKTYMNYLRNGGILLDPA